MNKFLISLIVIMFFFKQIILLNADNDLSNDTYINTSNITYYEKENIVELAENSKININNTNILVDRGVIDYDKDKIEVFGDFYLYQELNILSGRDLVGNIRLNNFTATGVSYIYNNDLKIDSEKAKREDEIVYFYNNFLTPCEIEGFFNCPTWSLRIDETSYEIDKDKFTHYDSFLQIADYKVFYLPYFSHYGVKAPRQKGFLTPTLEFSIGGDTALITPYYMPLGISKEIVFKPKIVFDTNFGYTENFSINTILRNKNSRGNMSFDIYTEKLKNNDNIFNTAKFDAKQTLNKNNILTYSALITNSVSTTRSTNEEPATFEDIFLRLDSYDILYKYDYLRSEISTVEALDATNSGLIPLSPSLKYSNQKLVNNNFTLVNNIDFINLKRNESKVDKPSDSTSIKFNNLLSLSKNYEVFNNYSKIKLINSIGNYSYEHNPSLNNDVFKSHIIISSDNFLNLSKNVKPRLKFITNLDLVTDNIINEDSKALSFNYQNQYSDSRFYGTDLDDSSTRIIYGFENNFNVLDHKLDFNFNQSYDFEKETNYTNQINQKSNFSDIALEAKTNFNNLSFQIDSRLNNRQLEKKEMNYSLNYSDKIDIGLNYNETDSKAFKDLSSDTKSLGFNIAKKLNKNIELSMKSHLNLKDNYSPLTQTFNISLFDECSRLNVSYTDERFNDNYNMKPSETISISFQMDYLGFFGYEQKTNLFFDEPGNFNYGL